jgi:ribosomal protein L37AE/L43A
VSPEKQRIAIHEARGFSVEVRTVCPTCKGQTPFEAGDDYGITIWAECKHCNNTGKIAPYAPYIPNYLNDLNAIHEAEKTLPQDLRARWMIELCKLTEDSFWSTTRATAAQRA